MLLRIDCKSGQVARVIGEQLKTFGLNERDFQNILFKSLDRLLPDEELLLLAQSRFWQEEPDLLAIDERGKLYIFEIKVWESRSENLLQVLRYGQILGNYTYDDLDRIFRHDDSGRSLADSHRATFGIELPKEKFNSKQVFVVLTNGLDFRTRLAVQYWRSLGLEVRPWVYRAYPEVDGTLLLELGRFAVEDNPFEDVVSGYYILNTNYRNDPADHEDMIRSQKAAAYFTPWKQKIERLSKGDTIFLYQSGVGIVAMGRAAGKLEKAAYHGDPTHQDEEFFRRLDGFRLVTPAIQASRIKEITGINHRFNGTMFSLDASCGSALADSVRKHSV
mgnify:CR=1 FL=1